MLKPLNKIIAVLMAFVVLFSTMSFTLSLHYCGELLVDAAIFKAAEDCGMSMALGDVNTSDMSSKSCCEDKQFIVEGQDVFKVSFEAISFKKDVATTAILPLHKEWQFNNHKWTQFSFSKYKPPKIVVPVYQLYELYLI